MTGGPKGATIRSVATFGGVGILATITHVVIGLSLTEAVGLAPFTANIVAFMTAFLVSYFGHKTYSFKSRAKHAQAAPRFLAVAVLGLILNQLIVFICVNVLGWSYVVALALIVSLVPVVVYFLSRLWAFREDA